MAARHPGTLVPVLNLSDENLAFVAAHHAATWTADPEHQRAMIAGALPHVPAAHDAAAVMAASLAEPLGFLANHVVVLHNREPKGAPGPSATWVRVGGSTLHEALTEIVGSFEAHASVEAPDWVASTHPDLARLTAEHFTRANDWAPGYACRVIDMSEVPA